MPLKNVIIINDFDYPQGGASRVAVDTANILARSGLNVIFFSVVHSEEQCSFDKRVKNITINGSEALNNPSKIKGMQYGIKNLDCEKSLNSLLDQYSNQDTVVHVHGWTKACSSVVFKVIKDRRFCTVLTLHEYFSICPNGAYFNYKTNRACDEKCCSLKCMLTNCDSRNYLFKIYRYIRERQYYRDMDFNYINTIYLSNLQKDIIEKYHHCQNSAVLENPIDIEKLNQNTEKEFDYIYIGRTSKEKGIELFIRLAREFTDRRFAIVGDYESELPENIFVTGWVSQDDVNSYLVRSRCLVFPSLWPETFGLNMVKAVALGIPCLASSNTAAVDYVNESNGAIFEQGNFEDMRTKALQIEAFARNRIGNEEINNHSTNNYKNKLIDFYSLAIKRNIEKVNYS